MLEFFRDNHMNGNGDTSDERPLSFAYNNWQGKDFFTASSTIHDFHISLVTA